MLRISPLFTRLRRDVYTNDVLRGVPNLITTESEKISYVLMRGVQNAAGEKITKTLR